MAEEAPKTPDPVERPPSSKSRAPSRVNAAFPPAVKQPQSKVILHKFWDLFKVKAGEDYVKENQEFLEPEEVKEFYKSCVYSMFTNVPGPRAELLAKELWCRYVRENQGKFGLSSLEQVLEELYSLHCCATPFERRLTREDFWVDLMEHICVVYISLSMGTKTKVFPRRRTDWPRLTPAAKQKKLRDEGQAIEEVIYRPFDKNEVSRKYFFTDFVEVAQLSMAQPYPEDSNIPDGYDSEEEELKYYGAGPANRFLILAPPGTKIPADLAAKLSEYYACVGTDVFDLVEKEIREGGPLAAELVSAGKNEESVPIDTQAKLVNRVLTSNTDAAYRGYVFAEMPSLDVDVAEKFIRGSGVLESGVNWIVNLFPVGEEEMNAMLEQRQEELQGLRDVEQKFREEEAEEERARLQKEEEKAEKARKREERRKRQEEREANPPAEGEEEPPQEEEPEPEEEEAEPEVLDEEGNPVDPAELQAKAEALRKQRLERRDKFDVREAIIKGREEVTKGGLDPEKVPALRTLISQAKACGTYVKLNLEQDPQAMADAIIKIANSLAPSSVTACPCMGILTEVPAEPVEDEEAYFAEMEEKMNEVIKGLEKTNRFTEAWLKFCPVAYFEHEVIVEGSIWYACAYRGRLYYLSSKAALKKFACNPHMYLNTSKEKIIPHQPMLVMKKTNNVLTENGMVDENLVEALGERMQYTVVSFEDYHVKWAEAKEEERRVREAEEKRRKELEEERKRLEKERLAAEAKAKKAGGPKKDVKKKKEDEDSAAGGAPSPDGEEAGEGEDAEPKAPPAETPEMKIAKIIEAKRILKEKMPNILVDGTTFDEDAINFLYENRLMPESVLVIDSKKADAKEEEEGAEEEEEEPEEAPPEGEEPASTAVAGGAGKEPFDRENPKLYSKYIKGLMTKLAGDGDEDGDGEAEPEPEEEGGDGAGEGEEEGKRRVKFLPKQKFTIHNVNASGCTQDRLLARIIDLVSPFREAAKPFEAPEDGEEAPETDEVGEGWGVRPTPPSALGWANQYCPVNLKNGELRKGNKEFALEYRGRQFFFRSEAELKQFQLEPNRYNPGVPPTIPPPKIWVLGVKASGKTCVVDRLSELYGVPMFEFKREFFNQVTGHLIEDWEKRNTGFEEARRILKELDAFDAAEKAKEDAQIAKEKRKAEREARIEAGEEDDDDDDEEEEGEPWEPEEEDVKKERLLKAHTAIAADILKQEPFLSKGYIMEGYPMGEEEWALLQANNVQPECVLTLKLSSEHYVRRRLQAEWKERRLARLRKIRDLKLLALKIARKKKRREIQQWRRRNIGEDDEQAEEEDEEIEEHPEPVLKEDVISDLEGQFDAENGALEAMADTFREQNIDVLAINADRSTSTVWATVKEKTEPRLLHRQSFLETPYVVRYEPGMALLKDGMVNCSSFGFRDTVDIYKERHGQKNYIQVRIKSPHPGPDPPEPEDEEEVETPRTAERRRRWRVARKKKAALEALKEGFHAERKQEAEAKAQEKEFVKAEKLKAKEERAAAKASGELEEDDDDEEEEPEEEPPEEDEEDEGPQEISDEQIEGWQAQIEEEAEGWAEDFDPGMEFDGEDEGEGWPFDDLKAALEAEAKEEEENVEEEEEASPEEIEEQERLAALEARKAKYRAQPKCAIFRRRIYFFETDDNLKSFLANPWKYLIQPGPPPALLPAIVVIPEKSSPVVMNFEDGLAAYDILGPGPIPATLAEQVAFNLKAVYISEQTLCDDILNCPVETALAKGIKSYQASSGAKARLLMSDKQFEQALEFRLTMADVIQSGFVLDGVTMAQHISKNVEKSGILQRLEAIPTNVIVEHPHKAWEGMYNANRRMMADVLQNKFHNVHHLEDTSRSEWDRVYASLRLISQTKQRQQRRKGLQPTGGALPLYDTCLTDTQLEELKSKFQQYCPYNWIHRHWLVDASADDPKLQNATMYCGSVYRFSAQEGVDDFLKDPVEYLDLDNKHILPKMLPSIVKGKQAAELSEEDCEYQGFCPVTLYQTRENIGLQGKLDPTCIWGQEAYTVTYGNKFYRMGDRECMQAFMKQPWVYLQARLPHKVPLKKELLKTVHMDTYMEHVIYESVVRAMLATEEEKPLFPTLTPKESAIKYMAMYMKAHNPNNNPIRNEKYVHKYDLFRECCELFNYFQENPQADAGALRDEKSQYSHKAKLWDTISSKKMDIATFVSLQ